MPLGKDLLAEKLNYLQRGGGCCKKSEKILYNEKKYLGGGDFFPLYQIFSIFLQQPPPICKYFNFAANKFSSRGINFVSYTL